MTTMTREQFVLALKQAGVKTSTEDSYGRIKVVLRKASGQNTRDTGAVYLHNDKGLVQLGKKTISRIDFIQEDLEGVIEQYKENN